jgi:hypothetical protein
MRRVNIQADVESRRNIAAAAPVSASETVTEPCKTTEDGKTEEVQGSEDNTPTTAVSDTPPKRGRKTKGDTEKI